MSISRRRFLQLSTLASASLLVPKFLDYLTTSGISANRKLVVIQLSGGNDGLNTVIPYRNDIYYKSRPVIGIKKTQALALTDEAGLHPSLEGLRGLYDRGYVSILNSVGYPEPCRSHARSLKIWHSGLQSDTESGWLGRYLDIAPGRHRGVEIGETISMAMKGQNQTGVVYGKSHAHMADHQERLAQYLAPSRSVGNNQSLLNEARGFRYGLTYPDNALGFRMKEISALIRTGTECQVYYTSHGSFDTHVDQEVHHARLLKELDDAVSVFVAELERTRQFEEVMVLVFSEFGRRVVENETNGTDHGAANNMFVISGGLQKPGIYNQMPDLQHLDDGDVRYQLDFREVYATVLDKWLKTDSQAILGAKYMHRNFI